MQYMRSENSVKNEFSGTGFGFRLAEALWYISALLIIIAAGIAKLEFPLGRDQGLFLLYAMGIDRGASLYIELWDFKPPGVFWFYLTAGRLFGFNERGVHLLELVWLLALSVLMMLTLREYFRHKWLSAVAPVAVVGVYYVFARFDQATQVEILASLPIFACIWLLSRAYDNDRPRVIGFYFAGVVASVATVFKLVYAPLIIVFVLFSLYGCYRQRVGALRLMTLLLASFTAGVLTVWVPVLVYFWWAGSFPAFIETNFVIPFLYLAGGDQAPIGRLLMGLVRLLAATAAWLIFVALALPTLWRAGEPRLSRFLWTWLIGGVVVILIQRVSWHAYHWMFVLTPLGILACRGVDITIERLRGGVAARPLAAMGLSVILVLPAIGGLFDPLGDRIYQFFSMRADGEAGIQEYRRKMDKRYGRVVDSAAFVEQDNRPGPIYVFGSSLYHIMLNRPQTLPYSGNEFEYLLPSQIKELAAGLAVQRPTYIFLEKDKFDVVPRKSPEIMTMLSRDYAVSWQGADGRWYSRIDKEPGDQPAAASP